MNDTPPLSDEIIEYARRKNTSATQMYRLPAVSSQVLETIVGANEGDATGAVEAISTYLQSEGVRTPDARDIWWDGSRQASFLREVRDVYVFSAMLDYANKGEAESARGLAGVAAYLTEQATGLTLSYMKDAFEQKVRAGTRARNLLTPESSVVDAAKAVERVEQGEFLMPYRSVDVALGTLRECGEQLDLAARLRGEESGYLRGASASPAAIADTPEMTGSLYSRATAAIDTLVGTRRYVVDLCARSLEDIGNGNYAGAASRLRSAARTETGIESVQQRFESGLARDFADGYTLVRESRIPRRIEQGGTH